MSSPQQKAEKSIELDKYEQDIEDHLDILTDVENMQSRMDAMRVAATNHIRQKKSITLRVNQADLETIRIKASKIGVPYQTYINMIIHKEANN